MTSQKCFYTKNDMCVWMKTDTHSNPAKKSNVLHVIPSSKVPIAPGGSEKEQIGKCSIELI